MKQFKDKSNWQIGLYLFSQLTAWIAVPLIFAVFLGKWLDKKYDTSPWLFLLTVAVAFVISNIGIARQAIKAMKQIEKEAKINKNNNKNTCK